MRGPIILLLMILITMSAADAQQKTARNARFSPEQKRIVSIAALTAKGNLSLLKEELHEGLEAGLTISRIQEILVHTYAYCGFPRSIRGLQTFMEVLDERKARGIKDAAGTQASAANREQDKYTRGKKVLAELTGTRQPDSLSGYSAFAPVIDTFLKEHLFSDIFERDVLTYAERELATISVIAAIGDAEPMLRSHLSISLHMGITSAQLQQFADIIQSTIGRKAARSARTVLNGVLESRTQQ